MLISVVQQSDSVIHIYILFNYLLSQDIEYSSLCYMGGPYYLSILYIIIFLKNFCLFIQAAPGLCCCLGFSLVVLSEGYSLVVVLRLLFVVASLAVEHVLSCPEACGTFPD